jgi:hypothetical protein
MITLRLNDELMSYVVKQDAEFSGGEQTLIKFPNGYGASIVRNEYSYGGRHGQFELAVILWNDTDFDLDYNTPITDDVIGRLDNSEIPVILYEIMALQTATPGQG